MALEGIREDAIQETSLRYMTGMIEGQDTRFAPSIPQFVVEAKKRQSFMIAVENYNATPKLASAPVDDVPRVSPEKMQALADWFHGKIDGDELARITGTSVAGA